MIKIINIIITFTRSIDSDIQYNQKPIEMKNKEQVTLTGMDRKPTK